MNKDNDTVVRCPVCNKIVSDFECCISDPCEHVMLIYTDTINDEFVHEHDDMDNIFPDMVKKYEEEDIPLNEQMEEFADDKENYIVKEMTTYGMGCGPCSSTESILFKLK